MFRNVKIVVWALSLALVAAMPSQASARCTGDYLVCLNDTYPYAGGVSGAMSDIECGAGWLGCAIGKLRFW